MNSTPAPRVLLIDDDTTCHAIVAKLLKKLDIIPTCAKSAEEALKLTEVRDFDLIFMDLGLPGISGLELTKELRTRERKTKGHMLIIALTERAEPGIREECITQGMDGYLSKPIQRDKLMGIMKRLFPKPAPAV